MREGFFWRFSLLVWTLGLCLTTAQPQNDVLLVPKSIRWDLSIDSLQCSSQHSPGTNFLESIDAIFKHPANRIFPPYRFDHLPAEQARESRWPTGAEQRRRCCKPGCWYR